MKSPREFLISGRLGLLIATAALPHRQDGATWDRRISIDGQEIAYNDMLFWPGLTAGFHLPATVAPIGVSKSGLPLGVQITGPVYGDRMTLMADGFGVHVPKGYIYAAMLFSAGVETLNTMARNRRKPGAE